MLNPGMDPLTWPILLGIITFVFFLVVIYVTLQYGPRVKKEILRDLGLLFFVVAFLASLIPTGIMLGIWVATENQAFYDLAEVFATVYPLAVTVFIYSMYHSVDPKDLKKQ